MATSVNDLARITTYVANTPVASFSLSFPLFADGRFATAEEYAADLGVWRNGVEQIGNWTLDATFIEGVATDAEVVVLGSAWTGTVQIVGRHPPSRTVQFTEGRGVPATGYNLAFNIVAATMREIWDVLRSGPTWGPSGNPVDFHGARLTGLASGTGATDALTKSQIEAMVAFAASGGIVNAAVLVTYPGTGFGWGGTVKSALDAAHAEIEALEDDVADHETRITTLEDASLPIGTMVEYGGASAPAGWLMCAGQPVSRTTYSALFAVIGTAYGVGNGSTTFNVPNRKGRVSIGSDTMGGSAANVSQRTTTLDTSSGSPTATVANVGGLTIGMFVFSTNVPAGTTITNINGTTLTLSANASATASGTAARFSIVDDPQEIGGTGGDDVHTLSILQMPLHGHPARYSGTSSSDLDGNGGMALENDGVTGNSAAYTGTPDDTLGEQIGGTGGGRPHPNLPPVLVANVIIYAGV